MDAAEPPAIVVENAPAPAPPPIDAITTQQAPVFEPSERAPRERAPRAVDLGVGTFLMAGVGSSGVVGLSPFITDELGQDVFLRLSAAVGHTTASDAALTWVAGRLDTCAAIPGNYADGSGLRLDLCGGADVGVTYIASVSGIVPALASQTLPYVALGPSADLRAELGTRAALLLRGVLGLQIARDSFVDSSGERVQAPVGSARVELAFSWKLQ